ncbi:MAG TPA: Mur ligase family protein, partial [Gaiellaceae bacterium]|nr:Mur ligase family protein [Gaiellaceae bacterium]
SVVRPHVGVITAVGPVHLELVGTVERVAQAKAELLAWLPEGGTAVVPAHAPELEPHLPRERVELVRFGEGGDVVLERFDPPALDARVGEERVELEVPFTALHQAHNTLAALAAYRALGLPLERAAEGASGIAISPWRCEDVELPGGGLLVNDVYNANPASMVAALDHLRRRAAGGRTIAVLGGMAELGEESPRYHREVAEEARVDVLVAVGEAAREYLGAPAGERHWVETTEEAAALVRTLLRPGDAVLVKASRAYGLEAVADEILAVTA